LAYIEIIEQEDKQTSEHCKVAETSTKQRTKKNKPIIKNKYKKQDNYIHYTNYLE